MNVYNQLLNKFITWAQSQEDIRAAILVGSRARTDHPADEWSDLDLMIFADQPEQYLARTDWMSEIGEVWIALASHTSGNEPEYLVTFAGGYNVDFVFNPYSRVGRRRARRHHPLRALARGAGGASTKPGWPPKPSRPNSRRPPSLSPTRPSSCGW